MRPRNEVPAVYGLPVSRRGDLWQLGRHRLLCGDAQEVTDFARLLGNERADLVFTDPPYNVKIDGHVSGLGRSASRVCVCLGEMSRTSLRVSRGNGPQCLGDARRRHRFRLHGLAPYGRASDGGRGGVHRAQEPRGLEQDERRHGSVLSVETRADLCVQAGYG